MKFYLCLEIILITSVCSDGETDFDNIGMTAEGVFQSLESIFEVFQKPENRDLPQVVSLMSVFESCSDFNNLKKYQHIGRRNIFVVIEGLQASGSRYFASRLVKLMKAKYLHSPPICLSPFRNFFDQQNLILRSAFYALGNYIIAEQVKRNYLYHPIILNRFWHSQAAIILSHQAVALNGTMLPLRESPVYKWPKDLLVPDIVLLLTRQHDIHNPLWIQKRMVMTKYFRSLMIEAYLRMNGPSLVDVDGGMFKTRTYVTLRMLINSTSHNLHEYYKQFNLSELTTTKQKRFRLNFRVLQ